jgi:hypothetical protein
MLFFKFQNFLYTYLGETKMDSGMYSCIKDRTNVLCFIFHHLLHLTSIKTIHFSDDSYLAEDIPEDTWNKLSQSESEYEPSQRESACDSEQVVNDLFFLLCINCLLGWLTLKISVFIFL